MKDLSRQVRDLIRVRIRTRLAPLKVIENTKNRNVATLWNECVHHFKAEWSPYSEVIPPEALKPGWAYNELSQHKDSSLRNIVLHNLIKPVDHSLAAYLDGKLRDQMDYIARSSGDGSLTNSVSDISLHFQVNKSPSEFAAVDNWDDDGASEDDEEVSGTE